MEKTRVQAYQQVVGTLIALKAVLVDYGFIALFVNFAFEKDEIVVVVALVA